MSHTLYRKYRPKNFSEVIGQKHIVKTLENSIKKDRISHAYLFTGPRGTGKTSIARIFAKAINCQKPQGAISCEKCASCEVINASRSLDIIEIDAASNTGVDNIRELKETVKLLPTSLKYKVYIIDEVHMLSQGAFNALLKTLEEPPAHAVFILATTEIHKVPETILSRCQRFDFVRLPIKNIVEKLSFIAKQEKIKIDQDSLEMIAIAAEGGMRDAETLFSQVIALEDKNITVSEVEEILGTTDRKTAFSVTEMIIEGDAKSAIEKINELVEAGFDLKVFNKSLINYLRQLMLLKVNPDLKNHFSYEIAPDQMKKMLEQSKKTPLAKILESIDYFLEAQGKIGSFLLPQLALEMAIIKATGYFEQENLRTEEIVESPPKKEEPEKIKSIEKAGTSIPETISPAPAKKEPETQKKDSEPEKEITMKIDLQTVKNAWPKLLIDIKPRNHSLHALLANCQPIETQDNRIVIATPYDFYKSKMMNLECRLTIEEVLGNILGLKISLKVVTNAEAGIKSPTKNDAPSEKSESHQEDLLNSALEIFGGKIVEE